MAAVVMGAEINHSLGHARVGICGRWGGAKSLKKHHGNYRVIFVAGGVVLKSIMGIIESYRGALLREVWLSGPLLVADSCGAD